MEVKENASAFSGVADDTVRERIQAACDEIIPGSSKTPV